MNEQLKEKLILKLLDLDSETTAPQSPMIGKVCMVRTYSAGVHFGEVVSKHNQNVVLKNARRVWYWAKACSLSQLAMEGDKDLSNCKIAMTVDEIELDQVIELIPMKEEAKTCLMNAPVWKI